MTINGQLALAHLHGKVIRLDSALRMAPR